MECVMHQQLEIDQLNLMLILLDIINYVIANRVQMLHFVMAHTGKTVDEFQDKWFVNIMLVLEDSMNFGDGQPLWEQQDSWFGISIIESKLSLE